MADRLDPVVAVLIESRRPDRLEILAPEPLAVEMELDFVGVDLDCDPARPQQESRAAG
ncbi:MAG: hypothetical protein ABEK29_04045 [Bradymonadaceae bacterium]